MLPSAVSERSRQRRGLRVGMVSHSVYERDNRVMRYAQALAQRGDEVHVLSLSPRSDATAYAQMEGVHVHRLCARDDRYGGSVLSSARQTLHFGWLAHQKLRQLRSRPAPTPRAWDVLHVHNLPDVLIQTAVPYRRSGTGVILDIHDLMPEFFSARFAADAADRRVRWLLRAERWAASHADHILLASPLWLERYRHRVATPSNRLPDCSVVINHVEQRVFSPRASSRTDVLAAPARLIFPGGLHHHQGVDVAIKAVSILRQLQVAVQLDIYGAGPEEAALKALSYRLGLGEMVRFRGVADMAQIANEMAACDVGLVPKRADGFGNEAVSTKILEFMSVGLPVVASATAVEQFLFSAEDIEFVTPADPKALAQGIERVLRDVSRRQSLVRRGRHLAQEWSWQRHHTRYLALVDKLALRREVS